MGKVMKLLLGILLLIMLLTGCGKDKYDITVMDVLVPHTSNSQHLNLSFHEISSKIVSWAADHPEFRTGEKKLSRSDELRAYARLGSDHLSELIITDCHTGRLLAEEGLVMDLSEYFPESKAESFLYNGSVYALPIPEPSFSVIVSGELNIDTSSWEVLKGFGISRGSLMPTVFSSLFAEDDEWVERLLSGDDTVSFSDSLFLKRFGTFRQMLAQEHFYGLNQSTEAVLSDFIAGKCPAVIVDEKALYSLLESAKTTNPELYKKLHFFSLPGGTPFGYSTDIFINSKVAKDPQMLEACLDLARTLAQPHAPEEDETIARLEEFLTNADYCCIWPLQFNSSFWSYANKNCFDAFEERGKTTEEYAALLQNYYEQYYLNLEDFSTKVNTYLK